VLTCARLVLLLHSHSRVDFDKVIAVLLVDQEFRGAGVAVVGSLGQPDGVVEDGVPNFNREVLCRRKLDHLLVTSLDGAVSLVEVNDVAMVVAEQLNLDVLWLVQESFDKYGAVAESRLGLGDGALKGILELLLFPDDAHTAAAAAKGCLDDDGEAKLVGEALDVLVSLDRAGRAGDAGDVGLGGQLASGDLVSEAVNGIGAGADKLEDDLVS